MFITDKHGKLREYKFAVVTKDPRGDDYYHVGQIIIVEITGGIPPMEVGSQIKPGKLDVQIELFGTIDRAIVKSNEMFGVV